MQSKITLLGMYKYDNTIFDNLVFPSGIDKTLAVNRILNKSEEFEVVYSDPDYLKDRIGIWGEIWERTFTKWVEALSVEYDPLYNYDRHEIYTDTKGREYKDQKTEAATDITNSMQNNAQSGSQNSTQNGQTLNSSNSMSSTVTGSDTSSVTEQKKSAYDEPDYSDYQKEEASANTNQTGSGSSEANSNSIDTNTMDTSSSENTLTQALTQGKSDTTEDMSGTSNEVIQHEAHLFGNIGVTTSQQMLKDQLDVVTWNLYEHISDIFIEEFCILVY